MRLSLSVLCLAALGAVCLSVPVQNAPKRPNDVAFGVQDLLVLSKVDSQGKFKDLMPLLQQTVVYTGAVLPFVRAKRDNKRPNELTQSVLLQTVADAAGRSDLEKYLPTSSDMLDAMIAIGNVIGGSSGFNPVKMMTNVVGHDDMVKAIEEVMTFPLRFPDPTEQQIQAAENVVLSIGLGFGSQEQSLNSFIQTLSSEQRSMIDSLQKNVIEKLVNAMIAPNGEPSQALVDEIKRAMRDMEQRTGSTDGMPEDLKELTQAPSNEVQALLSTAQKSSSGKFTNFLPLVNQMIVFTGVALPSLRAHQDNIRNSELTGPILVQTMAKAAGVSRTDMSNDMLLDSMIAIGNMVGGDSGFNPILLMSNIVGRNGMDRLLNETLVFAANFPDPSEQQILAAQQVVMSIGLGFGNQDEAINKFLSTLTAQQIQMIQHLQKHVMDDLMGVMMTPSGEPSPALVNEIKRQMAVMKEKTGSTNMMPQVLKDLAEEQAKAQALIAIHADSASGTFKNFIPLLGQVVVYSGAVLPSVRAHKEHKRNSELSQAMLVQTVASAVTNNELSELQKALPSADSMLDAMEKIGKVMGGSSGFNPISLTTNVVGHDSMLRVINTIMEFPFKFPDLTDDQLMTAEQVALATGLGFESQEQALSQFMGSLSETQRKMIESLKTDVFDKVVNSVVQADGQPTQKFVEEIKRQMREMEKTKGSTDMMPEELKELVKNSKPTLDEAAHIQSLIALKPAAGNFQRLFPLVGQVVTYATVMPKVREHNAKKLEASALLQSGEPNSLADLEKALPTAEDMLTAMLAIGNVLGGSSGFNPIQMLTNVVGGKQAMQHVIETAMTAPFRFPDFTDDQLRAAEQMLLSAGLGFVDQEQAITKLTNLLTKEQKQLIDTVQKEVLDKMINAVLTPEGNPTPAFVEEIKAQMREMEKRTGSTDMMPEELKELVAHPTA